MQVSEQSSLEFLGNGRQQSQKWNCRTVLELGLKSHVCMICFCLRTRFAQDVLQRLPSGWNNPTPVSRVLTPWQAWVPSIRGSSRSRSECRIATTVARNQHIGLRMGFAAVHILVRRGFCGHLCIPKASYICITYKERSYLPEALAHRPGQHLNPQQ